MLQRSWIFLTLVVAWASTAWAAETGSIRKTIDFDGTTYAYRVIVPKDYDPQQKWPVLMYMHGIGAVGTDGDKPAGESCPRHCGGKEQRFICVVPQAHKHWASSPNVPKAIAILDKTLTEYKCDEDRVYVTGYSAGGQGAAITAGEYSDRFAACVLVAGTDSRFDQTLKDIPIWLFHGSKDDVVGVGSSRGLASRLADLGAAELRYTEYPGVKHNSSGKAYGTKAMYDWLLEHKISDRKQPRQPKRPVVEAPDWADIPLNLQLALDRRGQPIVEARDLPRSLVRADSLMRSQNYGRARDALNEMIKAGDLTEEDAKLANDTIADIDRHEKQLFELAEAAEKAVDYERAKQMLELVQRQFAGTPAAERAGETITRWRTDPKVREELTAMRVLAKIDSLIQRGRLPDAKGGCEGIIQRWPETRAAALAKEKLAELEKKLGD